ncbi:DUF4034 domain-containing protein, partial [Salmonella enterica subsp. enterica serovar Anatum]|nr:DUF4034 domain-containing protein [Salmonella enterica subsp. enterica serovar Anatum]
MGAERLFPGVWIAVAHSGLSFTDAVCPNLPRPSVLPECNDDAGQKYWLAVCLAIFP